MPPNLIAAVLATAALTAAITAWWQRHRMRRALDRERAAAMLTEGVAHRDRAALQARIRTVTAQQQAPRTRTDAQEEAEAAVLADADHILTTAIRRHVRNTPEGGPT